MYNMSIEDPGAVSYAQIGGLSEQVRELREVTYQSSAVRSVAAFSLSGMSISSVYVYTDIVIAWSVVHKALAVKKRCEINQVTHSLLCVKFVQMLLHVQQKCTS